MKTELCFLLQWVILRRHIVNLACWDLIFRVQDVTSMRRSHSFLSKTEGTPQKKCIELNYLNFSWHTNKSICEINPWKEKTFQGKRLTNAWLKWKHYWDIYEKKKKVEVTDPLHCGAENQLGSSKKENSVQTPQKSSNPALNQQGLLPSANYHHRVCVGS